MNNDNQNKSKYKKLKIAVITESILLAVIATFIVGILAFNLLFNDTSEHLLATYKSPDNSGGVTIYEIGRPFLFGASQIRIYSSGTSFETQIYNDGASLSEYNYSVEWVSGTAYITLRGEEQEDITYTVTNK